MPRFLIQCAGDGSRWAGAFNTSHKQFIKIEGEELISRTVRQCLNYTTDTWVVTKPEDANLFIPKIGKAQLYKAYCYDEYNLANKFLDSKELWSYTLPTVVLFGDVWYTDEAIATIVNHCADDKWLWFCRPHKSELSKKRMEGFGVCFHPRHIIPMMPALYRLAEKYKNGTSVCAAGWGWFHEMCGIGAEYWVDIPGGDPRYKNYIVIDDWTEDFDSPEDLMSWRKYKYGE